MPDERFEPMEIASGPDSDYVSGRWHGDGGEGMQLCASAGTGRLANTCRCSNMMVRPTCKTATLGRGIHNRINPINTIISLKSNRQSLSSGVGYSMSVVLGVGIPFTRQTTTVLGPVICHAGKLVASTCQRRYSWGVD